MATPKTPGRPKTDDTVRLTVNISAALDAALDRRVEALNAEGGETFDRSRVVRAMLARELRAELKAAAG